MSPSHTAVLVGWQRSLASMFSSILGMWFFGVSEDWVFLTIIYAEAKNLPSFWDFLLCDKLLGRILENWSSFLAQSCWYFKFLFQTETKPNSRFHHFCPKQHICLCMVLVVIVGYKILWILFKYLFPCVCDFSVLIKSNIFDIVQKKAINCKYVYNFLNCLEDFKEIPFYFEMRCLSITREDGFEKKQVGSMKVILSCEAKEQ